VANYNNGNYWGAPLALASPPALTLYLRFNLAKPSTFTRGLPQPTPSKSLSNRYRFGVDNGGGCVIVLLLAQATTQGQNKEHQMTKKDFQLIAGVINGSMQNWDGFTPEAQEAIIGLARSLSIKLQDTNPRFNRDLFLTACGVK
jgi:hypothetical protein